MIRERLPSDNRERAWAAFPNVDRTALDLLARLPLTWAPLDQDKLTATEQGALKLLTAGELLEGRFNFRLSMIGQTSAVEATITGTGE